MIHHADVVDVFVHGRSPFQVGPLPPLGMERPRCILPHCASSVRPYSTLLPGPWAAADGLRWRASRESHPSEDRSELPHGLWLWLDRSIIIRLLAESGRINQPQCETARHRPLSGRMGTALHLPWPSLMRAHARTGGPCASSHVAPAPSGASRQRTYPAAGYAVVKDHGGARRITDTPSTGQIGPGCCS